MVPTKRFWLLAALGIPLAAASALAGAPGLVVLYNLALLGAAWITTRLSPSVAGLRLTRRFDPVLSVRVANRVQVVIENDGPEPISALLRDEAPPTFLASRREFVVHLEPGRETAFEYTLTPPERGDDAFRGTFLRVQCPLGLAHKQVRLVTEEPVRVYPNVLALRNFDLLKQQGRLREMGIRRARMRGLGTEFESLREYSEGDDYRKIDWKATARRDKVIVRQYEQERNQAVILAIDVGRHMLSEVNGVRKLDHALDAILLLAHAAAAAGDFVGLLVYGDTVHRYIPPKKGRNQIGIIIEAIHDLVAEPMESDPSAAFSYLASRWKRRSLLVNFTDVVDDDRARDLVRSLGGVVKRHLTLIARVHDPKLEEARDTPLDAPNSLYIRAAADLLLADKRAAASVLTSAGLHHLEAEPQNLAAALVSFYFEVKARSLL